jgi:hypothetical protein
MKKFSNNVLAVKNFDLSNAKDALKVAKTLADGKQNLKALESEFLTSLFHFYISEKRETVFSLVLINTAFQGAKRKNLIDYLELNGIHLAIHKLGKEKLSLPKKLKKEFSKLGFDSYLESIKEEKKEKQEAKKAEQAQAQETLEAEKTEQQEALILARIAESEKELQAKIDTLLAEVEALKAENSALKEALTEKNKKTKAA